MVCFLISCVSKSILRFETLSLVNRVIELGICVTHFPCINEQLETLYLIRIRRFLLCQRRNLDRMIHDKCWLDQFFFTVFLEEQVDDITLLMTFFIFNMMLICKLLSCFIICNFIKVNSCIFLDRIIHGQTFKRFAEIDLDTIVGNLRRTTNLLCQITEHRLSQFHHAFIICICLIKLHQSKLRIMTGIYTFITEYTSDLINSLKTTNDQSLQIKLKRNTKLNIFVQCIIMSFKRSCCSTACICNQHRSFHFHEVTVCKEVTDFFQNLGTFDKYVLAVLIHDKVYISLTITHICICQSMEFLRKNL